MLIITARNKQRLRAAPSNFFGPTVAALPIGMSWDSSIGKPSGVPGSMELNLNNIFSGSPDATFTVNNVSDWTTFLNGIVTPGYNLVNVAADVVRTTALVLPNKGPFPAYKCWIRTSDYVAFNAECPHEPDYRVASIANRVNPANSNHTSHMRILTIDVGGAGYFEFAPGAEGYFFSGFEITNGITRDTQQALIEIAPNTGQIGSETVMPKNIGVDRCYIHGSALPPTGKNLRRAIRVDGQRIWVSGCTMKYIRDKGLSDSQCIWAAKGGRYGIVFNNHMEAMSETYLFGGDGFVPITTWDPSDWAFCRNYITIDPAYDGTSTGDRKNLGEFKHMVRGLDWGNVRSRYRAGGQAYCLITNVSSQAGGVPWAKVWDITYWANKILDQSVSGGILDLALNGSSGNDTLGTQRVEIAHMYAPDMFVGSSSRNIILAGTPNRSIQGLKWHHCTLDCSDSLFNFSAMSAWDPTNIMDISEIVNIRATQFSPFLATGGTGNLNIFNSICAQGSFRVHRNLKKGTASGWGGLASAPHDCASYVNDSDIFIDAPSGNHRLKDGTIYKSSSEDGSDPGCDFDTLEAATGGVI